MLTTLFNRIEVAAIFKVSTRTVKNWQDAGLIKATYPGRGARYSAEEVERLAGAVNKNPSVKKTEVNASVNT